MPQSTKESVHALEVELQGEKYSETESSESIISRLEFESDEPLRINGVVVGKLAGFDSTGVPQVEFHPNPSLAPLAARSTIQIDKNHLGREVALLFEQGDPRKPVIMGLMWNQDQAPAPFNVRADGGRVEISAEREIVLRCGEASLTLTKAGKILIRGKYVLSRSAGVNRIKGGSVQIN